MGVSRAGYYKWKKRDKSKRDIKREELVPLVSTVHAAHRSHGYRWTAAYIRLEYGYTFSDNYIYKLSLLRNQVGNQASDTLQEAKSQR